MLNEHVTKIKIVFSFCVFSILLAMTSGTLMLRYKKDSIYLSPLYWGMLVDYLKYKETVARPDAIASSVSRIPGEKEKYAVSVPVLLYHGILITPDGSNVVRNDFEKQMRALKYAGYETVSIDDFHAFMRGEKKLPEKSFLLTFDDSRKDSFYPADPLLKALGFKAVMFVITKYSILENGSNYYLSKNELGYMLETGRWELQTHTRNGHDLYPVSPYGESGHFYSNKLWRTADKRYETTQEYEKRIYQDFIDGRNDLMNAFGIQSVSFAFPFGDFAHNNKKFTEAKDFILAYAHKVYPILFYQTWGGDGFSSNFPDRDQFLLKRLDVHPDWTGEYLLRKMESGQAKNLPFREQFKTGELDWIDAWGVFRIINDSIRLGSAINTSGGFGFLDGSLLWKNYRMNIITDLTRGSDIFLVARFKDPQYYVACDFGEDTIKIRQRLRGEEEVIAAVKSPDTFKGDKKNIHLGIAVNNNSVQCFLNGHTVTSSNHLSRELDHGGVAFKSWDQTNNNSLTVIKGITVDAL